MKWFTRALTTEQIGRAAEHLVCLDLMSRGYAAHINPHGASASDVIVKIGSRFVPIQVKSTFKAYIKTVHETRHGTLRSRKRELFTFRVTDREKYRDEVELFAFVAVDEQLIRYYPIAHILNGKASAMTFTARSFRANKDSFEKCGIT